MTTVLLGLILTGCVGDGPTYQGYDMGDFFPFDAPRTWRFASEDEDLTWQMEGVLIEEPEVVGGVKVYTTEFGKNCFRDDPPGTPKSEQCKEGDFVRSWSWSFDQEKGAALHAYALADGTKETFDPPVRVSTATMKRYETIETDGTDWVSTFEVIEPCPVQWQVNWDECVKFDLDDGDGDPSSGHPMSGTYWVVAGYNVVAFDNPGEPGRWELLKHIDE